MKERQGHGELEEADGCFHFGLLEEERGWAVRDEVVISVRHVLAMGYDWSAVQSDLIGGADPGC